MREVDLRRKEPGAVKTALVVVAFLLVACLLLVPSAASQQPQSGQRRLGFGFIGVGGLIVAGYTPQQFFNGMFLTPPYPSTVELTVQDNSGVGLVFQQNSSVTQWLLSEMQLASAYPSIRMVVHMAFNISSAESWGNLEGGFLSSVRSSPYASSIGAVGFDIEQTNLLTSRSTGCSGGACIVAAWQAALARMQADAAAGGWQFNSYYPQGISAVPNTGQYLFWQSSQPWAPQLTAHANNTVGINVGGAGLNPFPSPECDYAGNPHWSVVPFPQGYHPDSAFPNSGACSKAWPATLPQVMAAENLVPQSYRQWVIIYAGNNGTGYCSPTGCDYAKSFVGASGMTTSANWDNPAFRSAIYSWILSNPNSYLLDGAQPATSTTGYGTTTSTTTTTTSAVVTTGGRGGVSLADLALGLGVAYVFGFVVFAVVEISRTGLVGGRRGKHG